MCLEIKKAVEAMLERCAQSLEAGKYMGSEASMNLAERGWNECCVVRARLIRSLSVELKG